jgi:hypothetical protein
MAEAKIVYFEAPNKEQNTDTVLRLAKQRAGELGIKTVVVASTSGWTALKAIEALQGFKIIIVGHSAGFKGANEQEFKVENRKWVQEKGAALLFGTHTFGGLSRAMRQSDIKEAPTTYIVGDLVATTLKIFGPGVKVACEIGCMAVDAGLIRSDEECILIAGNGREGGANTAIVAAPEVAHRFFSMRVWEILCKPRY